MNTTTFNGVRITLFGHASVCFEYANQFIYVDPFVLSSAPRPAALILHTHKHHDHCVLPSSITTSSTTVIGRGCKHPAQSAEIGSPIKFGTLSILPVHAYNTNKPFHPKGEGAGYILTFNPCIGGPAASPVRVYVAGDTDRIPEMANYRCDIAILPVGGTYTMTMEEAAEAVAVIMPKIVIPYHCNYLSDLKVDLSLFKAMVAEKAKGVDVRILTP